MKFESSTPDLPNPADSIPTTMEDRPVKVEPSDTLNGISDCRPTSTIDSLPGLTSTMADTAVKTEQSDASHGLPRREATPSFTALDNATQLADTAVKIEPSDASYGLSRHEPTPSSAALDDVTRLAPMTADCKDEINCSQSDDNLEELPPHNFVKAFKSLQDPTLIGLPSVQPPVTSADFNRFRFDPRYSSYPHKRTVAAYVVALRNKGELPPGGHQAVQNMLKSLFRIEGLTPAIDHDYSYSWILRTIMGECGSGGSSLASKPYSFPPLLSEQASIVLDHFQDDLNIGVTAEASASPTPPTPPISADEKSGGKDRAKKPRSKKRKIETTVDDQSARPKTYDMENPTLAAMMHNIQRGKGMSRIIDPSLKRNHNRFGSNGLGVGEWWPFHICALRDGAHGSAMGGIAGSSRDGAKSIVIGGEPPPHPPCQTHSI